MSSDVITICLVVMFGGTLAAVGVLALQLFDRKHELQQARVEAQRFAGRGRRGVF